jgi:hypothetical protein
MRYRFDVHNGTGFTPDEEGQLASGPDAARHIAIASIRAIVAEEAGTGMVDLRGKIDVRCEDDDTGFTVAFIDAFDLLLPPEGP